MLLLKPVDADSLSLQSGRVLFSGYNNGDIVLWDALEGSAADARIGSLGPQSPSSSSPKQHKAGVNTVVPVGGPLPAKHCDRVSAVTLAPTGDAVATGSWDFTVRVSF